MTPTFASAALLALFLLSWAAAAVWVSRTTGVLLPRSQLRLYGAGVAYFVLVAVVAGLVPAARERLWRELPLFDWAMVAACAAGFAWAWWARLHLGKLWSGGVALKEGHRVVDTGPYAIVRHPIYTAAFVVVIAFAAIRARPFDIAFAAGVIVFFTVKARVEERFLRDELGPAYDDYRARVPMLLPGARAKPPKPANPPW